MLSVSHSLTHCFRTIRTLSTLRIPLPMQFIASSNCTSERATTMASFCCSFWSFPIPSFADFLIHCLLPPLLVLACGFQHIKHAAGSSRLALPKHCILHHQISAAPRGLS
ncbi:hypothetical protein M752DRAFT_73570 [Aspergillus phoenicis ATCC 13157]|uniref:Uncharacterized protein n=1 Tax=Aspergillus phoenicis ATCC 13157 TaxID=1353007 RepID=A0A370PYX8_ASPPH|nr:hypothetical protein M752DRAFT_73570 [Aspergillus phoenicis ATCC 13157]